MSALGQPSRRSPARRRRRWPWAVAALLGAAALLWIGVAIGQALGDRPRPGGEQTIVRTLDPLPQRAP